MELCDILGITINEFLAGEDIQQDVFVQKADRTLLEVSKDHLHRIRSMKRAVLVLILIAMVLTGTIGTLLYQKYARPTNYIEEISPSSTEMKGVRLFINRESVHLFRYSVKDEYQNFTIYFSEYQNGQLIQKKAIAGQKKDDTDDNQSINEGVIGILVDREHANLKLAVDYGNGAKLVGDFPLTENAVDAASMTHGLENRRSLKYDEEQGIFALAFNQDAKMPVIDTIDEEMVKKYDSVYYVSFLGGKAE